MLDRIKVSDLTTGERLFLWRKREEKTQAKAAEFFGVTLRQYHMAERDKPSTVEPNYSSAKPLEDREKCVILRRRAKMTQAELAHKMGVCRYWVQKMEAGDGSSTRLVEYWGE